MRNTLLIAISFVLAHIAGCSAQAPTLPTTVTCKGTAYLPNGEPLKSVRLMFNPEAPAGSIPIEGMADTDSKGQFELASYKKGDGIVPGHYVITVDPFDYMKPSPVKNKAMAAAIPKKYDDKATSDIKVEITGENTDLQIRLKP